ncbi:MAG: hypothetical protein VB081_13120, partial [Christensenella sp.]|uniref:hypothetical protein n=1 Tax=Christensenella sp. TaxID=1935934 RepID=UPI002B1F1C5A
LLYLLIKTENIEMGDSTIKSIVDSHNELAKILLLRNTLLSEELLDSAKNSATSWILLYELYAEDQINEDVFVSKLNINKNLNMYQRLKSNNVHFVL